LYVLAAVFTIIFNYHFKFKNAIYKIALFDYFIAVSMDQDVLN